MKIDMKKLLIRLYAILLAIVGIISTLFFFPSSTGCSDMVTCLLYSFGGLVLFILGVGIFFLRDLARKMMVLFSFMFIGFFIFQTIWLIKNDHTGQGLVGMMLLVPIFLLCLFGVIFLLYSRIKEEFKYVTKQSTG
jgi:hypothetical protein